MCECYTVYDGIDKGHKECIIENFDVRQPRPDPEFVRYCDIARPSLVSYAAFDVKNKDIVMFLLDLNLDLENDYGGLGFTCVHEAVLFGEFDYLKLFLDRGADINIETKTTKVQNVFDIAKHHSFHRMMQLQSFLEKREKKVENVPQSKKYKEFREEIEDWNW